MRATYQYTHLYSKFDPQEGLVLNYEPKQSLEHFT